MISSKHDSPCCLGALSFFPVFFSRKFLPLTNFFLFHILVPIQTPAQFPGYMIVDFLFHGLGVHTKAIHRLATWMLEAHVWIFLFAMNDQMNNFYTKDIHDNDNDIHGENRE